MNKLTQAAVVLTLMINSHWATAEKAVFAGGCFWCVEEAFQDLKGVPGAVSGFTGGSLKNPSYRGNHRGHYEAVEVSYDPQRISYQQLLDIFWVNIDPFDSRGQFCDKGPSYRSALFVSNDQQRQLAKASRAAVVKQFPANKVDTPILDAAQFWPVEEYHQDYYEKNPIRYHFYRRGCGRDNRLKQIWGDAAKH